MKELQMSAMPGTSPMLPQPGIPSLGRIATLESLREHLQWAIELEHFTIPPYLCALYSLDPARNSEAVEVSDSARLERSPISRKMSAPSRRRALEARLIEDPKGALERELQVKVSSGGGRA